MQSCSEVETCSGDQSRNSCFLFPAERGEYDSIAAIRMIMASLSILGTLTIIILAIGKRQIFKSTIHPIFVLSVADFILACLWVVGGTLWQASSRIDNRAWCLVVSLFTIIFQCITINMTLVYAIMAFYSLKSRSGSHKRLLRDQLEIATPIERVWGKTITIVVYIFAWVVPALIVMVSFASVVGSSTYLVKNIQSCSCWCLPVYGNIIPYAFPRDLPTAKFVHDTHKLFAAYGIVVSLEYLIVFVLLVIVYYKLIRHIRNLRQDDYYEQKHREIYRHGFSNVPITHSQSQAKTRVMLFLLVFVINGFFNFLLSMGLSIYEVYNIPNDCQVSFSFDPTMTSPRLIAYNIIIALQSLTLPLQGFLNAIVYGWTRRDFVENMALMPQDLRNDVSIENTPEQLLEETKKEKVPERYSKERNRKRSSHGDSVLQSRQFNTTSEYHIESIQTTETDTEA